MKMCSTCGQQWAPALDRCPADGTALVDTAALTATGEVAVALAVPADDELAPGTMVGEYRIERAIGQGGMGVVYGAVHPLIGKRAAIKVLHARHSADREGVARFIQEAQAVNKIGHANIVDVFAFGTLADGRAYFVMEWLTGRTLEARIDEGALPIAETGAIMLALVRAVEAAHAAGVIHRDLKPENVFLVADDDAYRVKLLDFGIAKLSTAHQSASRTATGETVGTPLYMSPEQARGVDIDERTDLYSLGVVAYEMLCGKTPFAGEASAIEVLHAHLAKPPRAPRELRPEIPAAFDAMILSLLAKRASDRPSLAEVRRCLTGLATLPPPSSHAVTEARRVRASSPDDLDVPPRRRTGPLIAGGLALALVGVVAIILSRHDSGGDAKAPPRADPVAVSTLPPPPPTPVPLAAPIDAPAVAVVNLEIEPGAAAVTIDGKPVAGDHGHLHVTVDPGAHVVSVKAPGFRTFDQKLDAVADHPTELAIRLVRAPTAPVRPTPDQPAEPDPDGVVNPFKHK